jgi:hypothetical protein
MILLRLSKAIRQQDWFAVCIEFAVVVLGIFAGLQANEWAQERQDRKQERAALERLFLESESAYALLQGSLQQTERLNRIRRAAVQFADSKAPVPENELPLKIGINTLARFPPVMPVSVAYDELKAAGQMQLIRSAELRSQLAEFHTELAYYNQLQEGLAESVPGFFDVYQRHVIWDYNPESTTTDILLSTYDWESLRSDEAFMFAIIGLLRNQLVSEQGLAELRDRAKSLCESLGDIVQRPCGSS